MTLRLTVLLGPSATVEAAELRMGALPHTLAMAVPFDGWNEAAGGNVLPSAMAKVAEMFLTGIKRGEHLAEPAVDGGEAAEPPPDQPASPAPVVHASAGPDTTAWETRRSFLNEVAEQLDPGVVARYYEALDKARRIVALVERRAA